MLFYYSYVFIVSIFMVPRIIVSFFCRQISVFYFSNDFSQTGARNLIEFVEIKLHLHKNWWYEEFYSQIGTTWYRVWLFPNFGFHRRKYATKEWNVHCLSRLLVYLFLLYSFTLSYCSVYTQYVSKMESQQV